MKLKKLHITGSLLIAGLAITTLQSNSSGIMGRSTQGCAGGGCHSASANSSTAISISGLPGGGWIPNTAYTLTLTVANSTAAKAGFDLTVNVGTIAAITGNTMAMGTELHHTAPQNMASGMATWSFRWTSPASTSTNLTMKIAGNAVNGNGSADNGDSWNLATVTSNPATTSIANTLSEGGFSVSPNPAQDYLMLSGKTSSDFRALALTMDGKGISLSTETMGANSSRLSVGQLPAGIYRLMVTTGGKTYNTPFVKK